MTWDELVTDYEIIGSTIQPTADALPLRLMPVYRKRGTSGLLYLSVDSDDSDQPPALTADDAEWVRSQLAVICDPPILPKKGSWLMQINPEEHPEYLPKIEVPARLQAAYEDALRRAEKAAVQGELAQARKLLFFASRAHPSEPPSEPLPQMALIPLLRPILSPEDLAFHISDIPASFPEERIQGSLELLRAKYENLWLRLNGDPGLPGIATANRPSVGSFLDRYYEKKTKPKPPRIMTLRNFWGGGYKTASHAASCTF